MARKRADRRAKTSSANGARGGAPKIYDLAAAEKIGPDAKGCMEWLIAAAKTATGRALLRRSPKEIARDILSADAAIRKAAHAECIAGAAAAIRRMGG